MSTLNVDTLEIKGSIGFDRLGAETAYPIPVDGILVLGEDEGSAITLGSGTLRGIRFLTPEGEPVVLTSEQTRAKILRAASGANVTLVHNDTVNVTEPTERLLVSSQQDIPLGTNNTLIFFAYTMTFGAFRWFVGDAEVFAAAVANNWDPAPSRFSNALDQLAVRAPVVTEGSVAFTSGNAVTLWSQTLAEGEVLGVSFVFTGGTDTAGTIDRSFGRVSFVASRSVGGTAATTVLDAADEVGTVSGGTLTVTTSVNDVLVQVTYTTNGTLSYRTRVTIDSVSP